MDIGWSELLLIAIVALIVVGPKELPGLFKTVGQFMGKARGMAREFQRSMEQAAEESGLNEAAKGLKSVDNLNLNSATKSAKSYAKSAVTGGKASPARMPRRRRILRRRLLGNATASDRGHRARARGHRIAA